ncbi:hypothetical protein SLE2022_211960 [Rubroshorea leprosula]
MPRTRPTHRGPILHSNKPPPITHHAHLSLCTTQQPLHSSPSIPKASTVSACLNLEHPQPETRPMHLMEKKLSSVAWETFRPVRLDS